MAGCKLAAEAGHATGNFALFFVHPGVFLDVEGVREEAGIEVDGGRGGEAVFCWGYGDVYVAP